MARRVGAMRRPLAWVVLCVALSKALEEDVGERGFLLVATSLTLERLWTYEARAKTGQIDRYDDLGPVLRDICRTSFRARLIVDTPKEAAKAEHFLTSEGPTRPHLWHDHHVQRLVFARRPRHQGQDTVCGFVP